ncbi:hypothetical protein LP414_29650 [Polaromonas sp. P1(28)-13]|nr:hypothetical protein LP414_29650 [Polaromonas sp. P1(28)-13]
MNQLGLFRLGCLFSFCRSKGFGQQALGSGFFDRRFLGAGALAVGDFLGAAFFEAGFVTSAFAGAGFTETGLAASCTAGALGVVLGAFGMDGFLTVAMEMLF